MATTGPLPPPSVALFQPDSGKPTQHGYEFLERLEKVARQLSGVTNLFNGLDSAAANTLISSLINDEFEALGVVAGLNFQTSSYTLVLTDKGKTVVTNVGSANNLTVPPNASVAFPVGTYINIVQANTGQTTIVAGAGVNVFAYNSG